MILLLFYVCSTIAVLYISLDLTWRLWTRKYSFIPSAPNVPWLGTVPYLGTSTHDFYKVLTAWSTGLDHLYILWIGPRPVIHTGCVEYIGPILRSQEILKKAQSYKALHEWLGLGLLTSTGEKWKGRRMALTSAFHFNILNDFVDIFETHAENMVRKLQASSSIEAIDVQEIISLATLDVICESSMGVKICALEESDSDYVKAVHEMKILSIKRMLNPLLFCKSIYKLTKNGKTFYKNLDILHNFTIDVINNKIKDGTHRKEREENEYGKKKVFLDVLLELYNKGEIDVEGIREEVDTFMFEGHDTISAGLSWTLYEIGRHPDIQQKLHIEIDNVSMMQCTLMDKIRRLKYLECVIKESARLHPPVPGYGRELENDLEIDNNIIPAGTEVFIEAYSVHMNEKYWENPSVFNPARFESEDFLKRNPYCYIPFSAGPRNCIGQKFAMLEWKVFIYYILSAFKVQSTQSPEEMEICYDLVISSANGINIEFYAR